MTLRELWDGFDWEASDVFTPTVSPYSDLDSSFAQEWYNHFIDRETITDDRREFNGLVNMVHRRTLVKWAPLIEGYDAMIREISTPSDERTETEYAAPLGAASEGYVLAERKEVYSDTSTADDFDRLIRVNEIRNFYLDLFAEYECLFIGVWLV